MDLLAEEGEMMDCMLFEAYNQLEGGKKDSFEYRGKSIKIYEGPHKSSWRKHRSMPLDYEAIVDEVQMISCLFTPKPKPGIPLGKKSFLKDEGGVSTTSCYFFFLLPSYNL